MHGLTLNCLSDLLSEIDRLSAYKYTYHGPHMKIPAIIISRQSPTNKAATSSSQKSIPVEKEFAKLGLDQHMTNRDMTAPL